MIQYDEKVANEVTSRAQQARNCYLTNDRSIKGRSYYDALDNLTNDLSNWEYEFYCLCKDDKCEEAKAYVKEFIEDINKMSNRFCLPTMANGLNCMNPIVTIDTNLHFARRALEKILEKL